MANDKKQDVFGEPEEWAFDYPWEIVRTGFWLWKMSGFQRLYTQDEVMVYDPKWIGDMSLAYTIYSHKSNTSPIMALYEQWIAQNGNKPASISALRAIDPYSNDGSNNTQQSNSIPKGNMRRINGK